MRVRQLAERLQAGLRWVNAALHRVLVAESQPTDARTKELKPAGRAGRGCKLDQEESPRTWMAPGQGQRTRPRHKDFAKRSSPEYCCRPGRHRQGKQSRGRGSRLETRRQEQAEEPTRTEAVLVGHPAVRRRWTEGHAARTEVWSRGRKSSRPMTPTPACASEPLEGQPAGKHC